MRLFKSLVVSLGLFVAPVAAQEAGNTILVLDASGSMWGQIDGVAKITIAQDVVTDLLGTLPADQNLGLTIYGHRTRGDCTDIETVVPPGPDTRDAIAAAVAAIKPLGKTPMTDSIIIAAEALRYTEEKATVILVSDGVETCNPDPCAAARLLEEAGIDFTAHVVGFDVGNDAEALAQMQCLAGETGGQFLTAANAAELASALEIVAAEPVPEPEPEVTLAEITFEAFQGTDTIIGDSILNEDIIWTVTGPTGEVLADNLAAPSFNLNLADGIYTVVAIRPLTEDVSEGSFEVLHQPDYYTAFFPEPQLSATLDAPDTAPLGATIDVAWEGPNDSGDYLSVNTPGEPGYSTYVRTDEGVPARLQMPSVAGTYEIRYISDATDETLGSRMIEVTPIEIALIAADTASAGALVDVDWEGPDYPRDFIGVGKVGDDGYINYSYTADGNPVKLEMPGDPGIYEIRYYLDQNNQIMVRRQISVTAVETSLNAPETAAVGASITVDWTGPDYPRDFLSVAQPGDTGYINYTYTADGNPATLVMPTKPGDYEIHYVLDQDNQVLMARPITVTSLKVTLVADSTAPMGATIPVSFDGPDYAGDFISVGSAGDENYITYTRTADGNPAMVQMPAEAGTYEIRYTMDQGNTNLQRHVITVTDVKAQLVVAAGSVVLGTELTVGWDGPGYPGDFIAIGLPGDNSYITYANVDRGNPVKIMVPDQVGTYEVKYIMNQDNTVLGTRAIEVTQ